MRGRRCAASTPARAGTLPQPPALSAAAGASATGLLLTPFLLLLAALCVLSKPCLSHLYTPACRIDRACTALLPRSLCLQCADVLSLRGHCSACSREDNGAEGEGRLPNDTGATSANPGKGFLDRASTWAPGMVPGAVGGGMWSADALAGLYGGGWGMAQQPGAQPADLAGQQGVAAAALHGGAPSAPEGDWRSVVQAAAAAASQLEISKLSGRESTRSMDVGGDAPLASPPTSLCRAQRAPATVARFHHKVTLRPMRRAAVSPFTTWEIVLLCGSAVVLEAD